MHISEKSSTFASSFERRLGGAGLSKARSNLIPINMKKGLSTNKEMPVFYGRVIAAIESEDMVAIIKVCAGKSALPLLYRVAGCGISVISFDMIKNGIESGGQKTSEIDFNEAFYKSVSEQLAMDFCNTLHKEYVDKKFDTFVNKDEADVPTSIGISLKGSDKIERETFDFSYGMEGEVVSWLSER